MGFVLPKLNFALTKKIREKKAPQKAESKKEISLSRIWTLIYNFNKFEKVPTPTMNNLTSNYTLIKDFKNTLNWKRVLYNMLGDKLFNEN